MGIYAHMEVFRYLRQDERAVLLAADRAAERGHDAAALLQLEYGRVVRAKQLEREGAEVFKLTLDDQGAIAHLRARGPHKGLRVSLRPHSRFAATHESRRHAAAIVEARDQLLQLLKPALRQL